MKIVRRRNGAAANTAQIEIDQQRRARRSSVAPIKRIQKSVVRSHHGLGVAFGACGLDEERLDYAFGEARQNGPQVDDHFVVARMIAIGRRVMLQSIGEV